MVWPFGKKHDVPGCGAGAHVLEKNDTQTIYQCENGHIFYEPRGGDKANLRQQMIQSKTKYPAPSSGGSSVGKLVVVIVILGVLAYLAYAILSADPVFGIRERVQPYAAPIYGGLQQAWCRYLEPLATLNFGIYSTPGAVEEKCGKQIETKEGYNKIFLHSVDVNPSFQVRPGRDTAFTADVTFDFLSKDNQLSAFLSRVQVVDANNKILRNFIVPKFSECTKEKPCAFNPLASEATKNVKVSFDWFVNPTKCKEDKDCISKCEIPPEGESGVCKEEKAPEYYCKGQNVDKIRIKILPAYNFPVSGSDVTSYVKRISVSDDKEAKMTTVLPTAGKNIVGPVSVDTRLSGKQPYKVSDGELSINVVIKNNGELPDLGDATISKLSITQVHAAQTTPLIFQKEVGEDFGYCGSATVRQNRVDATTEEIVFSEFGKIILPSNSIPFEMKCSLKVTDAGDYTFTHRVAYEYKIDPTPEYYEIKVNYDSCPV